MYDTRNIDNFNSTNQHSKPNTSRPNDEYCVMPEEITPLGKIPRYEMIEI